MPSGGNGSQSMASVSRMTRRVSEYWRSLTRMTQPSFENGAWANPSGLSM